MGQARALVVTQVVAGKVDVGEAALLLGLSERSIRQRPRPGREHLGAHEERLPCCAHRHLGVGHSWSAVREAVVERRSQLAEEGCAGRGAAGERVCAGQEAQATPGEVPHYSRKDFRELCVRSRPGVRLNLTDYSKIHISLFELGHEKRVSYGSWSS
jgi:hypothetical protein